MMRKKVLLYIVFTVSFAIGMICFGLCVYMADNFFYTMDGSSAVGQVLSGRGITKARMVRDYINRGDTEGAKAYCDSGNFDVEIWRSHWKQEEDELVWSSFDSENGKTSGEGSVRLPNALRFYNSTPSTIGNQILNTEEEYLFYVYIDMNFPKADDLKAVGEGALMLYRSRYGMVCAALLCLLLSGICFALLVRGAGYRKDREGVVPGVLTRLPFDLWTLAFLTGEVVGWRYLYVRVEDSYSALSALPLLIVGGTLLAVLFAAYFVDLAVRIRMGGVLRKMFVLMLWRWFLRGCRGIWRGCLWIVEAISSATATVIVFLAVCLLELAVGGRMLGYVAASSRPAVLMQQTALLWGLEKVILFAAVLYMAFVCKKLLRAGRGLAEGQEDCRVDTCGMFGEFKEHGENLNSIGQGISRAVEERMRSERLKTELITNVSHDLKTPLTSIINYAELICKEKTENEKIEEYAEVLFRQSGRLKKLLDDLLEASKATTGSIEVNLEPCEAGVLLTQAVGEYQSKMEEKGLELIVRQPEEPVKIMADGRHLWRVFDNLLNNICKYSRENSRVFLSIETRDDKVFIVFRNMSKYILDVPPQELAERFVRGDKSRHMEGSGLGLSIAESLTALQGGRMEIVTDGDLFKVILSFGIYDGQG